MARPGIEPRSICYTSQELNHSATAAEVRHTALGRSEKSENSGTRKAGGGGLDAMGTAVICHGQRCGGRISIQDSIPTEVSV